MYTHCLVFYSLFHLLRQLFLFATTQTAQYYYVPRVVLDSIFPPLNYYSRTATPQCILSFFSPRRSDTFIVLHLSREYCKPYFLIVSSCFARFCFGFCFYGHSRLRAKRGPRSDCLLCRLIVYC